MNNEMLKGNWNQIRGSVKESFGKLTDNDMLQIEGSVDQAVGVLQERYGYTKQRAEQEWNTFVRNSNHAARSVVNQTDSHLQEASNRAGSAIDNMVDKGSQVVKDMTDSVKNVVGSAKEKLTS